MMKKLKYITVISIVLVILGIWSPWRAFNISWLNLLGINQQEKIAGLSVASLAGDMEVYIDGEFMGTSKEGGSFLEISPVKSGERAVTLSRRTENASYVEVIRKINFQPGVEVVIGYELGPTEEFSEGHIFYAREKFFSESNPTLDIYSVPSEITVYLDGVMIGETPIRNLPLEITKKHKLSFEKVGYDPLEIEILPDQQEERDKLGNLSLILEINLFAQPVRIIAQ